MHSIQISLSSASKFSLDKSKILSFYSESTQFLTVGLTDFRIILSVSKILDLSKLKAFTENDLTLSRTTNFRCCQTEKVCRQF